MSYYEQRSSKCGCENIAVEFDLESFDYIPRSTIAGLYDRITELAWEDFF